MLSNRKSGGGCSAIGCTMRRNTNLLSEVKMFRFPKDPDRRASWCNAMKRDSWTPSNNSLLCNAHFITGKPSTDPLHPDYVPSVFKFKQKEPEKNDKKLKRYERTIKRSRLDSLNCNPGTSSGNFMSSNSVNGLKENEILKTLLEMKAEHCDFQKEVLTRLLSIEKEINHIKNVLHLNQLPKTSIITARPSTSEPPVEIEKNNLRKHAFPCKHSETQTVESTTKPLTIYLEPPCETETSNTDNALCMCKHPDTEIVRGSTKPCITDSPSETEVNKKHNPLWTCKHPEPEIVRLSTKPNIIEIKSEIETNNTNYALCMRKHHETQIVNGNTVLSMTEIESETESSDTSNVLCMCKCPETQIAEETTMSIIMKTPGETETNKIHNSLCMCKHHNTQIGKEMTRPSVTELSSETDINQSDDPFCIYVYRQSETCVANSSVKTITPKPRDETDEIDLNSELPLCMHPEASVTKRSGLPKLPIDSLDSLLSIEEWLEDKDNVQILTRHFCTEGGDHVRDTTKRILQKSFTQNIAVSINWTGKNHKYPLSKSCLAQVIIAAVKLTHRYENVTEKLVEEHIKSWFRFAKDRDGGREKRRSASNIFIKRELL